MIGKKELKNRVWNEFQKELTESKKHEFRDEEVNHLWKEYLESIEALMQRMVESEDSLEEWKSLFYAMRGFYLYRVSLQDMHLSFEESTEELKELVRNMKSTADFVLPEEEEELFHKQMENADLESEILKPFQCWRNYETTIAKMRVEHIDRLAAAVNAKRRGKISETVMQEDQGDKCGDDEVDLSEKMDIERDDYKIGYFCSRDAAVRLREFMGNLPEYQEWMETF